MRLVRHRGKWAVRIDGKRLSTGVDARPETRDLAERAGRAILDARARALSGDTVSSIIAAYLEDMPRRANPKTPGAGTVFAAANIERFFADHAADQVTREECRAYVDRRRAEGKADGTIRKELAVLAAALRWHDPSTPARFDFPAPGPARTRWLSRDEADRLIKASTSPHVTLFIHLAFATGGRREALLGLQWATHIDFERSQIWLGFKRGGKGRATVPMTAGVRAALQTARDGAVTPFVIEWGAKPVADIKRALKAAYVRAGLDDIDAPAHVLRHTAGAWMAQAGVPMLEISRRLGHSSIVVTEKHYAHLHPDFMQAGTDALELRSGIYGVTACSIEQKTRNRTRTNAKKRERRTSKSDEI